MKTGRVLAYNNEHHVSDEELWDGSSSHTAMLASIVTAAPW